MKCKKHCNGCPIACGKGKLPDIDIFKNLTTFPEGKGERENLLGIVKDDSDFPNYSQSTIMGSAKILIATLLSMKGDSLTIRMDGFYNKKRKVFGDFEVIVKKIKRGKV